MDPVAKSGAIHRAFVLEKTVKRKKSKLKANAVTNFVRKTNAFKDTKDLRYSQFVPLYDLWSEYFSSIVGNNYPDERLLRADYHGCLLIVIEADNKTQIGTCGIVVRETRNTFQMITKKDRFLTIPKQGTVFQFALQGRVFTLFGDAFINTSAARSQKKIKARHSLPFFLK